MKYLLICLLFTTLCGCAGQSYTINPSMESQIYGNPSMKMSQIIAEDIANYIATENLPTKTSMLLLAPKESEEHIFAEELELAFRKLGFSISSFEDSTAKNLSYTIKIIDERYYVVFAFDNAFMTRSYDKSGAVTNWTRRESHE